jgi:hypothetical protein
MHGDSKVPAALAILEQVPDVVPDAGDELPKEMKATASSSNHADTHRPSIGVAKALGIGRPSVCMVLNGDAIAS